MKDDARDLYAEWDAIEAMERLEGVVSEMERFAWIERKVKILEAIVRRVGKITLTRDASG